MRRLDAKLESTIAHFSTQMQKLSHRLDEKTHDHVCKRETDTSNGGFAQLSKLLPMLFDDNDEEDEICDITLDVVSSNVDNDSTNAVLEPININTDDNDSTLEPIKEEQASQINTDHNDSTLEPINEEQASQINTDASPANHDVDIEEPKQPKKQLSTKTQTNKRARQK